MRHVPRLGNWITDKKPFGDLAFGCRFIFYGKTYTKIALNMAEDEKRQGNVFMYQMEVEPIEGEAGTGKPNSATVR